MAFPALVSPSSLDAVSAAVALPAIRVVIGLGNPGPRYDGTRHNIGFDAVAAFLDGRDHRRRHFDGGALLEIEVDGRPVSLLLPTSYMNRSGGPVRRLLRSESAPPEAALVVCDDIALPLGAIRTRRRGSDGGHNGLRSVLGALATNEIPRMRLGVGAPPSAAHQSDYVLDRFAPAETEAAAELVARAASAIECAIGDGIEAAMNRFNRTPARDAALLSAEPAPCPTSRRPPRRPAAPESGAGDPFP